MTDTHKDNISSRTSDKKKGTAYDSDAPQVESQDSLEEAAPSNEEE